MNKAIVEDKNKSVEVSLSTANELVGQGLAKIVKWYPYTVRFTPRGAAPLSCYIQPTPIKPALGHAAKSPCKENAHAN